MEQVSLIFVILINCLETVTLTFNNKKILYDSDGNFLTNDDTDTNISFQFFYLSDKDKMAAER